MTSNQQTVEYGAVIPGMVSLKTGDVVHVFGRVAMVVKATEANAHIAEACQRIRTVTDRVTGESATFKLPPQRHIISTTLPKENVLHRQGAEGLSYFLKTRTVQGFEQTKQQEEATEGENSMAAKTKKARNVASKTNENKEAKAASTGRLGGFKVGDQTYSTCSVLRRLGMAKVGVKHAQAIMDAAGVKAAAATVAINIGAGARGKGSMAQITKEQVEELKSLAKDPEAN